EDSNSSRAGEIAERGVTQSQALQNLGPVDVVSGRNPRTLQRHINHGLPPRLHPALPRLCAAAESYSSRLPVRAQAVYLPVVDNKRAPRSAPFPAVIGSISHRENGLPVRVLDLSRPGLLDVLHDTLRHRNIVEFLCHLAPVLVGPSEELERLTCCGCITRLLVDENPGHSGHRP